METPESLDTLISMVARPEEFEEERYSRGLENMEEMGGDEDETRCEMKKRRLSVQQVRSLEKNFEVENKLEPDRKMQLAKELGLQPRQVAVWFQNRRARWKTKQLERDYGVLKLNYDSLKSSFDAMHKENQKLTAELSSVRKRVEDAGNRKGNVCQRDDDSNVDTKPGIRAVAMKQENYEEEEDEGGLVEGKVMNGVIVFNERLEGSESDSSAILNDNGGGGGGGGGENNSPHTIDSYICTTSSLKYSAAYMQPSVSHNDNDNKSTGEGLMEALRVGNTSSAAAYNPQQCFRIDEPEESCNLFNVDDSAAATLPWWEWP